MFFSIANYRYPFVNAEVKIAGHSTDFVNRVLERVKAGEPSGGLDEI